MQPLTLTAVTLFTWDLTLWSVSQETSRCGNRWFGSRCQYKCRCSDDMCDKTGGCLGVHRCQNGWFGPACQYVDLAYKQSAIPEITDGDDGTCLKANTLTSVNITCGYVISWFRVHFQPADDAPVDTLASFLFNLKVETGIIPCGAPMYALLDNWTLDIDCTSNQFVEELILTEFRDHQLCSVLISGGRNVALRQHVAQSSNYSESSMDTAYREWFFPAELAVDGTTNQNLITGGSCSQTSTTGDHQVSAYWTLTLDLPAVVNRYVIYVREDATPFQESMVGFKLQSFGVSGELVFDYLDQSKTAQSVYMLLHTNLVVSVVNISTTSQDNILHICEFEMYGDTLCPDGKYGAQCEHTCQCMETEKCMPSTGQCATRCPIGYTGARCNSTCPPGTYGRSCEGVCSSFCAEQPNYRSCDHVTGDCLNGCHSGYQPPACFEICEQGTYGASCEHTCSPFCFSPSSGTVTCNHLDGTCLYGCEMGYTDERCNVPCLLGTYGKECKFHCSKRCAASNGSTASSVSNSSPCDHVTGNCKYGCSAGYNGTLCNTKLTSRLEGRAKKFLSWKMKMIIVSSLAGCFALVVISGLLFCVKKRNRYQSE